MLQLIWNCFERFGSKLWENSEGWPQRAPKWATQTIKKSNIYKLLHFFVDSTNIVKKCVHFEHIWQIDILRNFLTCLYFAFFGRCRPIIWLWWSYFHSIAVIIRIRMIPPVLVWPFMSINHDKILGRGGGDVSLQVPKGAPTKNNIMWYLDIHFWPLFNIALTIIFSKHSSQNIHPMWELIGYYRPRLDARMKQVWIRRPVRLNIPLSSFYISSNCSW